MNLRIIMDCRIEELENKREHYLTEMRNLKEAVARCSAKIEEVKHLQNLMDKEPETVKKKNIQENIRKNTLKDVLVEPDDAKRFNFFLTFKEKCGEETNFVECRKKMGGGKIETVLYRKNRLWFSWKEFLTDYKSWQKREGRWANVLVRED